jgi:hypothetical protein
MQKHLPVSSLELIYVPVCQHSDTVTSKMKTPTRPIHNDTNIANEIFSL